MRCCLLNTATIITFSLAVIVFTLCAVNLAALHNLLRSIKMLSLLFFQATCGYTQEINVVTTRFANEFVLLLTLLAFTSMP